MIISGLNLEARDRLFFPVDKSEVKILPQKFEYELVDDTHFRVGDVTLNFQDFKFQIESAQDSSLTAHLQWPSGLLSKGQLLIKDNSGKSIWNSSFSSVEKKVGFSQTDIQNLDPAVVQKIKLHPYFRFCINSEEPQTKIYLCSTELNIKTIDNKISVVSLPQNRKDSFVEINGTIVGPQGIIFLQSKKDPVNMKAQMNSGAFVEINTRIKEIDFKDIYATEEKNIFIHASGAEPVHEEIIKKRNNNEWEAELDMDAPLLYLKGEGGIPLRQEFIVSPKIRPQNLNVFLSSEVDDITYSSGKTLYLKTEPGITLEEVDKKTKLEKITETEWKWTLNDFLINRINRRFVRVKTNSGQYLGAIDFFRSKRFEISTHAMLYPLIFDFRFQQGLSPRWSWDFEYTNFITKSASEPNLSLISGNLFFRFKPGLLTQALSHQIFVTLDLYSINSVSAQSYALGGLLNFESPSIWKDFFQSYSLKLKFPISGSSLAPASGSYLIEALARKKESEFQWEYGLRIENYGFKDSNNQTTNYSRYTLVLGGVYQF